MYNNYGYNPYYQPQKFTNPPQQLGMEHQYPLIQQQSLNTIKSGLQGKMADSMEMIKATDIPLDGSISYFPLTDGSAIVSKQLQTDGTSKIVVYKPTQEDKKDAIQFATLDDIQEAIDNIDFSDIQDLKDDIKEIKKQLKEFKSKKSKDDE